MAQSRHNGPWVLYTLFVVSVHLLARCGLNIPEKYKNMVYLYTLDLLTGIVCFRNYFSERGFRHILFWIVGVGMTDFAWFLSLQSPIYLLLSRMCMLIGITYCVFYITEGFCKKPNCVFVLVYSVLLYCTQYHYQYIVMILTIHEITFLVRLDMQNLNHFEEWQIDWLGYCIDIIQLMFVCYLRGLDGVSEISPFWNFLVANKHLVDIIITLKAFFNSTTFEMDKWKIEWSCSHAILLGLISILYYDRVGSV